MPLTSVEQKFILHWGEMGTRWGINRTVAQVHALLFLSPKPLHAEEIATTLSVARSNVSTSLRELQGWGVVRVVHVLGDRRDHFASLKNVWEMFRIVSQERKRREIDPTLRVLHECVADLKNQGVARAPFDKPRAGPGLRTAEDGDDAYTRERLEEMLEFLRLTSSLFDEVVNLPPSTLKGMARLRGRLKTLFGADNKVAGEVRTASPVQSKS